jgi:membrane protein implicated in regulation of membrane protease activity
MRALLLIGAADPDNAAWARWLRDVMESWPAQLAILLLFVGLAVLLVRHASREWEDGARNRYLVGFLIVAGVFLVAQFLFGSSLLSVVDWPAGLYVIEFVVLFALWLYAFVRFMTRQRSGPGDDQARGRGADLERVIGQDGRSVPAGSPQPPA